MDAEQVLLVRSLWPKVAAHADSLTSRFYSHLFELDDSAARLFVSVDMAAQRTKLTRSLAIIVDTLDDPERLLPPLAALAKRHAGYGVEDRHFDSVRDALLWALADVLDGQFTPEAREAWAEAYTLIACVMRRALLRNERAG
jgi:hemoglobin-like flavoprotein